MSFRVSTLVVLAAALGLACAGTATDEPIDGALFLPRAGLVLHYAYYDEAGEELGREAWEVAKREASGETVITVGTREHSRYRVVPRAVEIGFHDAGRTEWGLYMPRSVQAGQHWVDDGDVAVEVIEVARRSFASQGRRLAILIRIDYTPESLGPDRPSTEFEWLAEGLGIVERRAGDGRVLDMRLVRVEEGS